MISTLVPKACCPECHADLDTATSARGDYTPEHGDVSVCVYCGALLQFDPSLALVPLSEDELESLDDEIVQVLKQMSAMVKERAK